MATGQMSEVIQHLRRTVLLRDGAGLTDKQLLEDYISRRDEAALEASYSGMGRWFGAYVAVFSATITTPRTPPSHLPRPYPQGGVDCFERVIAKLVAWRGVSDGVEGEGYGG